MPAAAPAQPAERIDDPRAWHLRRLLGEGHAIQGPFSAEVDGRPSARLTVALRDGTPVTFILPLDRPPSPPGGGPLLVTIGFVLVSLGLLGTWAVLALMKPLGALEATVEAYGPGRTAQPLTETGPREIRTVARALNRMQERISRLMDDRTRTLAAVGQVVAATDARRSLSDVLPTLPVTPTTRSPRRERARRPIAVRADAVSATRTAVAASIGPAVRYAAAPAAMAWPMKS